MVSTAPGTPSSIHPHDSASQIGGFAPTRSATNVASSSHISAASPLSIGHVGQSVLCQPTANSIPGHFACNRCKLTLPNSAMSLSKKNECKKDTASYKSLSDRWTKTRSLRTWWQNLDGPGQVTWFRKQHSLAVGTKRQYDECTQNERETETVGNEDRERDHYVPWRKWRDAKLSAGWPLPKCEEEWSKTVDNPDSDKMHARGEWLLPLFEGVIRDRVHTTSNSSEQQRSVQVESVEQLQELRDASQRSLHQWLGAYQGARTVSEPAPQVSSVPSDQSVRSAPPLTAGNAISREVCRLFLPRVSLLPRT